MNKDNELTKDTKGIDRGPYEEAFMNLMSSPHYVQQSFYSFVIAKMQVSINRTVPTAGAGFFNNNYQLIVNPDFFNPLPVEQRIGILLHECNHVILKHIFRKGERDHKLFNVACDIALNQSIPRNMLPEGALYPDTFKDEKGKPWPENLTAEQYYELAKQEQEKQEQEKEEQDDGDEQDDCDSCGGSGEQDDGEGGQEECENCKGSGKEPGSGFQPSNGNPDLTAGGEDPSLDDHSLWDKITSEEEELASEMMEKIIEGAMDKSRGNVPGNMEDLLKLWKRAPKLSWKKILKRFVSSKKGARIGTIKRRNRRIRTLGVKGQKVAYDQPEIVVGIDTSGSMSNEEIIAGLQEVNEVCKITNSNLKVVQIDTQIQGLEEYDPKKKDFKRRGCGGTYMGAMAEYLKEEKINFDVLVMISDMYIEDVSTDSNWKAHKKPTLWLSTSGEIPTWNGTKGHTIYNITDA